MLLSEFWEIFFFTTDDLNYLFHFVQFLICFLWPLLHFHIQQSCFHFKEKWFKLTQSPFEKYCVFSNLMGNTKLIRKLAFVFLLHGSMLSGHLISLSMEQDHSVSCVRPWAAQFILSVSPGPRHQGELCITGTSGYWSLCYSKSYRARIPKVRSTFSACLVIHLNLGTALSASLGKTGKLLQSCAPSIGVVIFHLYINKKVNLKVRKAKQSVTASRLIKIQVKYLYV